jgi:pimeloyl-ACP methyl ester carboxylesterase
LALWAAARQKVSPKSDIYGADPIALRGVVALAPPVDLERSIGPAYEVCKDSVITKLLGGLPDQVPLNYDNASPISLLPTGVPQRLIVGEYDIPVILEHTAVYFDSALTLNEDIRLDTIKQVGHNGIADPCSIAWPTVRAAIKSLLVVPD